MGWGSLADVVNKLLPGRKEQAINELQELEQELGKALASNNDMLAAAIRKRLKNIRKKFPDVE